MKKWFSRFEPTDAQQSVVGKQLCVGRHAVTVEDTIAEGRFKFRYVVAFLLGL